MRTVFRLVPLAIAFSGLVSCGSPHTRTIDRDCYDDLTLFAQQQAKLDRASGRDTAGGGLTREQISEGVKKQETEIKACTSHLLPNERSGGKITFDFLVTDAGRIAKACATETYFDNPEFNTCVLRAFRKATFARPNKGAWVTVRYPFTFE